MPKIKTRDVVKGTIKKIDKAAIAADRMRSAYVQTKEKAEHAAHPEEHSAEEYASDRIEGGVKPEKVVPFTVTKEQAQKQFKDYFKGKKLLPNLFLNGRNRICEMRGRRNR